MSSDILCAFSPWCRSRGVYMKRTYSCWARLTESLVRLCFFLCPSQLQPTSSHQNTDPVLPSTQASSDQRRQSLGWGLSCVSSVWVGPLTILLDRERQARGCSASITGARVAVCLVYVYPQKQKWKFSLSRTNRKHSKGDFRNDTMAYSESLFWQAGLNPLISIYTALRNEDHHHLSKWPGLAGKSCWRPLKTSKRRAQHLSWFFMSSFKKELKLGLMALVISKGSDTSLALWEAGQLGSKFGKKKVLLKWAAWKSQILFLSARFMVMNS